MISKNECVICKRVEPKIVFNYLHKLLDEKTDKKNINRIGKRICFIINELDKKHRIFFCGKSKFALLGGIFYLIINDEGIRTTQREISYLLPSSRIKTMKKYNPLEEEGYYTITEVTIRNSIKKWLKMRKYVKEIPDYSSFKYLRCK